MTQRYYGETGEEFARAKRVERDYRVAFCAYFVVVLLGWLAAALLFS